jgi:hypothetical protein
MSLRVKNLFSAVLGGGVSVLIVGMFVLILWVKDVRDDRRHIVIVNAATPVFVGTATRAAVMAWS